MTNDQARHQRAASLDLGTNTFRLLIGEPQDGGKGTGTRTGLRRLLVENRITRLGESLHEGGPLAPQAVERALAALSEFRGLMDARGVSLHRAVGTSALRRASNAAEFVDLVRERTGILVDIIDGSEEARLTAAGVLWSVGDRGRRAVIFDIGGGSTEFDMVKDGRLAAGRSLEMGVVRLTERFLAHDPPSGQEMALLRGEVARRLAEAKELSRGAFGEEAVDALNATAGTPTTVAAMMLGLTTYDAERVNGYILRREALEELLKRLSAIPSAERLRLPGLERGREDLILAGICIILGAMLCFVASEAVVSDGGLLEGVLLDLLADPAKGAALSS
jgi:exopolyphosphatase/guanosine-5'-triphosphate,3'-diphosphate pyrophosphatase